MRSPHSSLAGRAVLVLVASLGCAAFAGGVPSRSATVEPSRSVGGSGVGPSAEQQHGAEHEHGARAGLGGLGPALAVLAAVAAWGLARARRRARELAELAESARRLGRGDCDTPVTARSRLRRVRPLAEALEHARRRIAEHRGEQDRLIASLEEARAAAEAASRAKAAFLANMSHELRTPMNSVVGFADLLRDTELDLEQREMAETIYRGGSAITAIIGDILEFAKVEAGHLELEREPYDPATVIEEVCALLLPQAAARRLSLGARVAPDVPCRVLGDEGRLRQVLVNLVGNALKFTDTGGVDVSIAVEERSPAAVVLRLAVRDTGIGIASADRERLFAPFTQADDSVTRRHGGTGLGLAICRELVGLMGGAIEVTSEPGDGSTFRFTVTAELPAGEPAPALPRRDARGPQSGTTCGPRSDAPRVLVVEDEPVNRRVAASLVRRLGYETETAADGAEALARLAERDFDLVLMDCHMPVVDGYEATRRIRAREGPDEHLPVVALTADAVEDNAVRVAAAGMDAFLTKPTRIAQLEDVLARWCPLAGHATDAPAADEPWLRAMRLG